MEEFVASDGEDNEPWIRSWIGFEEVKKIRVCVLSRGLLKVRKATVLCVGGKETKEGEWKKEWGEVSEDARDSFRSTGSRIPWRGGSSVSVRQERKWASFSLSVP